MHKKTPLDHYPKSISERIDLLYQRITQRQNLPPSLKPFLESVLRQGCTDIFPFEYSMPSKEISFFDLCPPQQLLLYSFLKQLKLVQITFGYILEPGYVQYDPSFVYTEEYIQKKEVLRQNSMHIRKDIGKMPSFVMLVEWIWTVKSICIIYYFFQYFKDGYYL